MMPSYAIMAVDPGETTGVAAAYIEDRKTLHESLTKGIVSKKSTELTGDWLHQSVKLDEIAGEFRFRANSENGIPLSNIHLVFEHFILQRIKQGGATGNLTSVWVIAGTIGRIGHLDGISLQMPSNAKSLATNERLKQWGLWEKGSPHIRDAWRHLVFKLNELL